MKLTSLRPMLYTGDLKGTIHFYTTALGFTCDELDEEAGWASLSKDNVDIMLARPNTHVPFTGPQFTGSFYFNSDNVDQLWEALKGKATVCYPLEDFDYGMREFALYDNNGYLLQFGQNLDSVNKEKYEDSSAHS